jgi:hypothetical protein
LRGGRNVMNTILLLVVWVLIGLLVGGLVHTARLGYTGFHWNNRTALYIALGVGVISSYFGALVVGHLAEPIYQTPNALWVSIVVTVAIPFIWRRFLYVDRRKYD